MKSWLKALSATGAFGIFSSYTINSDKQFLKFACSSVTAQVLSDVMFHPIVLVNSNTKYNFKNKVKTYETVKRVYNNYGLKGFYRGVNVVVFASCIYGLSYYTIYKKVKENIIKYFEGDQNKNIIAYAVATIIAELILVITYPFDMITTRILSFSVNYKNLTDGLSKIVDHTSIFKSIRNLYTGIIPTYVLYSCNSVVFFVSFEMFRDFMAKRKGILSEQVSGWDYFYTCCFTGIVSGLLTNSLEVYAIQKQVHGDNITRSLFFNSEFLFSMTSGISARMFYTMFYTVVLLENLHIFGTFFGVRL